MFPLQVWAHCSVGEVNKFWETLPCSYIREELQVREDPACEHHGPRSVLMLTVSMSLAPTEAWWMSTRQYISVYFCISLCGVLSPANTASAWSDTSFLRGLYPALIPRGMFLMIQSDECLCLYSQYIKITQNYCQQSASKVIVTH